MRKLMLLIMCLSFCVVSAYAEDQDPVSLENEVVDDDGSISVWKLSYTDLFDYRMDEKGLDSKWDTSGGTYGLSYSQQDSNGEGFFANLFYAPDIKMDGEGDINLISGGGSGKVEGKMERWDIEAGFTSLDFSFFHLEDLIGSVTGSTPSVIYGAKFTYIDREFEMDNTFLFEHQTYYGGVFVGFADSYDFFNIDNMSVYWNIQGMLTVARKNGEDSRGNQLYALEGGNGFGLGSNGTIGLKYDISDSAVLSAGYKGQVLQAGDIRDSYKAWTAALEILF